MTHLGTAFNFTIKKSEKNSKKFKLAVDILKMKWYYKQAVADTTAQKRNQ